MNTDNKYKEYIQTEYEQLENGLYKKIDGSELLWNGNIPTHWMPLPVPPEIEKM